VPTEETVSDPSGFRFRYPNSRPSAPLDVSISWSENTGVMAIVGEIDAASVGLLRFRLAEISPDVKADLIVDMSRVTFLDSTGLSFLITAHTKLRSQGARLVVRSPTPQVKRLFEITALTSVLTIKP
jgi:anti-anti-sigma factor